MPFAWLRVLDRLQTMGQPAAATADARATAEPSSSGLQTRRLSLEQVQAIGKDCGLGTSLPLEKEVGALLDLFHELGMLVHYNDPELVDMVILDPQWLIDLISRIIRVYDDDLHKLDCDEEAQKRMPEEWSWLIEEGKLARSLAELLWSSDALTETTAECDTLLHLLQKFGLLLELILCHNRDKWLKMPIFYHQVTNTDSFLD